MNDRLGVAHLIAPKANHLRFDPCQAQAMIALKITHLRHIGTDGAQRLQDKIVRRFHALRLSSGASLDKSAGANNSS